MSHVGIDLEQFVTDPYGSGIQRVLQQLARHWPNEVIHADFVVPFNGEFLLLKPTEAATLLDTAFDFRNREGLGEAVKSHVARLSDHAPRVRQGQLLSMFSAWLLPEVSYLPSVLSRFRLFSRVMTSVMIGFDALPMTEPANYRFAPKTAAGASEYFRLLARADRVVCISEYSRAAIVQRLRRSSDLVTIVASPGGDHIEFDALSPDPGVSPRSAQPLRFLRVGTLEDRKRPREILAAFQDACSAGLAAELVFAGIPSGSDPRINDELASAALHDPRISWISDLADHDVSQQVRQADVFLSFGTEGFGIPVLESLALGTPVVFGGIQPAGALMAGRGAMAIADDSLDSIRAFFTRPDLRDLIEKLRRELSSSQIPTWGDFARAVSSTCRCE